MIPLPKQHDDDDEEDSSAAVWSFLLVLFFFKMLTVGFIFWQLQTWESGLLLGATTWYFFPPLILFGAGPVIFYYRLRKVRARREELRRAEWMVESEQTVSDPAHRH